MRIAATQINQLGHKSNGTQQAKGMRKKNSWADQMKEIREQKENVSKKRNQLIAETLENGGSTADIKEQLKVYDEQLKNLDEQMEKIMTDQMKEQMEKVGKGKQSDKTSEAKSEEEAELQKISMLTELSTDVDKAQKVVSVSKQVEQQKNITDTEIKNDNIARTELLERIDLDNPGAADTMNPIGASESAYKNLSELHTRISDLSSSIGESIQEIQDKLEKYQDEVSKPENAEKGGAEDGSPAVDELERSQKLTQEFLDNFERWSDEAEELDLNSKDMIRYLKEKVDQWKEELKNRSDSDFSIWERISRPMDVRG